MVMQAVRDTVTPITLAKMTDGAMASIAILLPDGTQFCRLNAFAKLDGSWGDVDVVFEEGQVGMACAWINGAPVLHQSVPGAKLIGIDIQQATPRAKPGPKPGSHHA